MKLSNLIIFSFIYIFPASCGARAQSVTVNVTGCGFEPRSGKWNIYLNLCFHFFTLLSKQSAASSSATQHAMPSKFDGWTECLNTRLPLPTLLCAGCSVKLIFIYIFAHTTLRIFYFTFLTFLQKLNPQLYHRAPNHRPPPWLLPQWLGKLRPWTKAKLYKKHYHTFCNTDNLIGDGGTILTMWCSLCK